MYLWVYTSRWLAVITHCWHKHYHLSATGTATSTVSLSATFLFIQVLGTWPWFQQSRVAVKGEEMNILVVRSMFVSYCGLTWPYVRLSHVRPSERPSRPVRFPCAYRAKFNSCVSATTFALPFYEKMKKDRDEKIHCRHWWGPRNAVTKDTHIHTTFRGKANFKCHQDVQILLFVVSHFPMQTSD